MKRTMTRLPDQMLRDEAEMRALYQSVGISPETTELAIQARRNKPIQEDNETAIFKAADDLLIAVQN